MGYELINMEHCLRLHDNRMLGECLERGNIPVPLVVIDPFWYSEKDQWGLYRIGDRQLQFKVETLLELKKMISYKGSTLVVRKGELVTVVLKLLGILSDYGEVSYSYIPSVATYEANKEYELLKAIGTRYEIRRYADELVIGPLVNTVCPSLRSYSTFLNNVREPGHMNLLTDSFPSHPLGANSIPKPEELGRKRVVNSIKGGEEEGLEILYAAESPSRLEPYLTLGVVSKFLAYSCLGDRERRNLLWDSYYASTANIVGSDIFRAKGPGPKYLSEGSRDPLLLEKWGKSPYPLVNEAVRKLEETGFISNGERMLIAHYFVEHLGGSHIMGARYFQDKLIGYCPWNNYLGWHWIQGTFNDNVSSPRRQFSLYRIPGV